MNKLQKAKELKEKLRISIKLGYIYDGTPNEIRQLIKELLKEIEKGCGNPSEVIIFGKRYNCGDCLAYYCKDCEEAKKICEMDINKK